MKANLGFAGTLLRAVAPIVPETERDTWRQQWLAELWVLRRRRGVLAQFWFVFSLIPQALWERKEWLVEVALQDVRFALRQLRRSPGFALVAVLTMAIGVGATTLIFSLANAVLLRSPAGIAEPERILQIGRDRANGFDNLSYSYFRTFRDSAGTLDAVAIHTDRRVAYGRGETTRMVAGQLVSGEYFGLLGVQAAAGRLLNTQDEITPGGHPVAVVSHAFWRDSLGGDSGAVGREIVLNGLPYTVVGVAAEGFIGTDVVGSPTDVWIPFSMVVQLAGPSYADYDNPGFSWLWVLGRLEPEATYEASRAELQSLYAARYEEAWGEAPDEPLGVVAGVGLRPDERAETEQLVTMMGVIVAIVLAITAANLAGLMLARGVGRAGELGVRVALGAGRARIVRQMLTESLVLAAAGGILAALLTFWSVRLLPSLLPQSIGVSTAPDLRVLTFAGALSLITGLVFGLAPALRASRADTVAVMKEGARLSGGRALWLRSALVVVQVALSFVLLTSAALMGRSLAAADRADPGYETRTVLGMTFDLSTRGYEGQAAADFVGRLLDEASAIPGVDSVGVSTGLLFGGWMRRSVLPAGTEFDRDNPPPELEYAAVTRGWFETLGIPVRLGTGFEVANSGAEMPPIMLLSESAADLLLPGQNAVGARIALGPEREAEIVGVVADIQNRSLRARARPAFYVPLTQEPRGFVTLVARGPRPAELTAPLRQVVARLDPDLAVLTVDTVHARMVASLGETHIVARLAGTLAAIAAFLAAIGLYGVVAYVANARSAEIGLRMALGARSGNVRALILTQGLRLAIVGGLIGLGVSLAAAQLLDGLLYGVTARDPLSLLAVGAVLLTVTAAAALIPARRATRIEPVVALRQE